MVNTETNQDGIDPNYEIKVVRYNGFITTVARYGVFGDSE